MTRVNGALQNGRLDAAITAGAASDDALTVSLATGAKATDALTTDLLKGADVTATCSGVINVGALAAAKPIESNSNGAAINTAAMRGFNTGAETVTAPCLLIILAAIYGCTGLANGAQKPVDATPLSGNCMGIDYALCYGVATQGTGGTAGATVLNAVGAATVGAATIGVAAGAPITGAAIGVGAQNVGMV